MVVMQQRRVVIQPEKDEPATTTTTTTIGATNKRTKKERKGDKSMLHGVNQQKKDATAQRGTTTNKKPPRKQISTDLSVSSSSSTSSPYSLLLAFFWTYGPYGLAGTLVYRAVWELQAVCLEYIFPEQLVTSYLVSIAIGLVCSLLLLTFPRTLRRAEWIATVLMIFATVFYIRGVWEIWDLVVFPEYPLWQTLAGFIPGFIVLWSMGALRWGLVGAPLVLVDDTKANDKTNLPLIDLYYPPWSKEWLDDDDDDEDEVKID
eukprot:scaffold20548_cov223-Amphora_coffeaeformis.AAC.4